MFFVIPESLCLHQFIIYRVLCIAIVKIIKCIAKIIIFVII
jgi:hypothetical protein